MQTIERNETIGDSHNFLRKHENQPATLTAKPRTEILKPLSFFIRFLSPLLAKFA